MVNPDKINLKTLNMEELTGVVSVYPWFALARKELCRRMAAMGDGAWNDEKFAEQALYMGSRSLIYKLLRQREAAAKAPAKPKAEKQIFIVGGDYFSAAQYEGVRLGEDDIFSSFAAGAPDYDPSPREVEEFTDFCTESLAKIYLDQGYKDKAKEIYSKLSLRYPEKSAYFASLIEKID